MKVSRLWIGRRGKHVELRCHDGPLALSCRGLLECKPSFKPEEPPVGAMRQEDG